MKISFLIIIFIIIINFWAAQCFSIWKLIECLGESIPLNKRNASEMQPHPQKFHFKNIEQMGSMAECLLVKSGHYKNADNILRICGKGSRGDVAADGIDECCRIHDACYSEYSRDWEGQCAGTVWGIPVPVVGSPYAEIYHYECNGREIVCSTKQHECEKFLCECDKALIDCWMQYPEPTVTLKCGESIFESTTTTEPTTTSTTSSTTTTLSTTSTTTSVTMAPSTTKTSTISTDSSSTTTTTSMLATESTPTTTTSSTSSPSLATTSMDSSSATTTTSMLITESTPTTTSTSTTTSSTGSTSLTTTTSTIIPPTSKVTTKPTRMKFTWDGSKLFGLFDEITRPSPKMDENS